jgi:hypothetical protein
MSERDLSMFSLQVALGSQHQKAIITYIDQEVGILQVL